MSEAFNANVMSRLRKLGFEESWELILNLPDNYDDYTVPLKSIPAILSKGHGKSFYATLRLDGVKSPEQIQQEKVAQGNATSSQGAPYVKVELSDGIRTNTAMVFGRIAPWLDLLSKFRGKVIHLSGKVQSRGGYTNLSSLEVVPFTDQNKIVPRYRGKPGVMAPAKLSELTQVSLIHEVDTAVDFMLDALGVDEATAMSHCRIPFNNLKQMLITLHRPKTRDDLEKALVSARRLSAYYEIRKAMKATLRQPNPNSRIAMDRTLIADLVKQHPFTPTRDQRQAIWDVIKDIDSETPMDRLISADVGNGKTMAYGIPAAYVASQGRNAVVMLPTEPLAGQVASNIQAWYPHLNVHLATSGFNGEVKQGDILVGTTALLSWLVRNPHWVADLAVVDEQQKMGTAQRDALTGLGTHILEATATPIPRTMAQTLFGHKKVSLIDDCPVEKTLKTYLLGNSSEEKKTAYNMLSKCMEQGQKGAVIYPLVAEQQAYYFHIAAETLKEAEKLAAMIKKAGLSFKFVRPYDDMESQELLGELNNSISSGFFAEYHGEESVFKRIQKRFDRYMGESAGKFEYMGSRVDSDMHERNRRAILSNQDAWEKKRPGRVAVIHGRSKRNDKKNIIEHMNNNGADILIATTLIEIGVDVKDLRFVLVLNAELLGSYTLHQLRGRLARNGGVGEFIMMTGCPLDELDPDARARLDLLVKYTSGKDIAHHDMEQRGFGNLAAGGRNQKGFDNGLFPSIKLTPSELDTFLSDLARDMQTKVPVPDAPLSRNESSLASSGP